MGVHLTQEQFDELLKRRVETGPTPAQTPHHKSFTKCTLRFNGERSHSKVEEFVTGISIYKQIEQIPDDDALTGLPLLLTDNANAWWTGIRNEIKTWATALASIRAAFAPKIPPHELYIKFFATAQASNESTDEFITKKRLILGMLPSKRHKEDEQLDFMYGLLRVELKKKIARTDVKTFANYWTKP
ncbi:Arc2, partial [Operophtera brumata]